MSKGICPRCKVNYYDTSTIEFYPAVSRRSAKTIFICQTCGLEEIMIDDNILPSTVIETEFLNSIGNQKVLDDERRINNVEEN